MNCFARIAEYRYFTFTYFYFSKGHSGFAANGLGTF